MKIRITRSMCRIAAGMLLLCLGSGSEAAENGIAPETVLKPKSGLPPFEYMEAPAPLPNYVAGARWGTQADPIRTMQKPLSPAESMRHLVTFPEFEVSLVAAEPDIVKPIWLSWDERGRLWIAETVDYPNELQPEGAGRDRLTICTDSDGDGDVDRFTVFADKLSIPTGFVFANGGVIVVHSGKTEFFQDTDGDDRADVRRVLFTGWGTRDTHATASNLRYGFDNWIWGVVGYSGFHGTVGGKEIRFGQGIFRFKPDGSELEFVRSSNNNTWGLGLTEDGIVIGSTANGNASMYMPIPNRYYEAVNGWSASRLETIADSQRMFPITPKVRQVDWHGRYTAGSGSAIYTARAFPKEYWNQVQFVAEPTGHLLGKFHLERRGADFIARNGQNFLASDDEWTSPVAAEVGPDGALWVIDWYNYIIQHNPTPHGFKTGKGNAYDTTLRDKRHGRIYRVAYRNAKQAKTELGNATPAQLVAALNNDNLLWRLHAQRLLVERGKSDVIPALLQLVRDQTLDELGLNPGAIHALWTLHGLGAIGDSNSEVSRTAVAALEHPSAGVRRAAANVLPRTERSLGALLNGGVLNDSDAQVRLAALLAISEMPPSEGAGEAIFKFLREDRNASDRWLPDAATAAAARNDAAFLRTVLASNTGSILSTETGAVVQRVTTHYAQRGPVDSIVATLGAVKNAAPDVAVQVLDGLVSGWPKDRAPALGNAEKRVLTDLMDAMPESIRDRMLALAQRWGETKLFGDRFDSVVAMLKREVTNGSSPDEQRVAAAKRLIGIDDGNATAGVVLGQVGLLSSPTLASGLVSALTDSRNPDTGAAIIGRWAHFTPSVRRSAVAALMRRPEWTRALLDAVEGGPLTRTDLAVEHWSQLKQHPDRSVARRAERLSAPPGGVSPDRQGVVNKLLPLAKQKGNPTRGKEVFTANCATCHVFGGTGGTVGPDLTGVGARDRTDILLEILDPNRSVELNYRLWNATTKDGETYSGRLDAETQTSVEILDTAGQKHVLQRKDLASLEPSQLSIMPSGFEALPAEDLTALLEYLAQPHP